MLAAMTSATFTTLGILGVALAACSNTVDSSENELPYLSEQGDGSSDGATGEVETSTGGDADAADPGGACDCLTVGSWYRFDTLAVTSIDNGDHPVISTLNGLWGADIEGLELNIMMEVTDVSDTTLTTRVVNGVRIDGTQSICALDFTAVEVVFPRSGCRLEASNKSPFNVYAGTESYTKNCSTTLPVKHAIPVSGAQLEATVSDDCGRILEGKVPSGGLGQAELDQICTCLLLPGSPAEDCGELDPAFEETACVGCNAKYQQLSQLLNAFGQVDWLCTTESGDPAACLTADFTATLMEAGPPSCEEQ